jgi:Na+(H+)/acetate symporter ActP
MRAVTWTQVAQYIVIIVAYMIPVVWLSVKQTGIPIPQAIYGYQLEKVTAKEADLMIDTHELSVRQVFADRAHWSLSESWPTPPGHWSPSVQSWRRGWRRCERRLRRKKNRWLLNGRWQSCLANLMRRSSCGVKPWT